MFWIEITVVDQKQVYANEGKHWIDLEKVIRMHRPDDGEITWLYFNDSIVNFLTIAETPEQILSAVGRVPMPPTKNKP